VADETLSAAVTPSARSLFHADRLLGPHGVVGGAYRLLALRLVAMNADKVAPKIMLAAERTAAGAVGTDVRLEPVGVVCGHVCFEIVRSGEC
jgi:hypothetical protein